MTCFVFTDLVLLCRSTNKRGDKLRIAKPPMHITRIVAGPQHETCLCLSYFRNYIVFKNFTKKLQYYGCLHVNLKVQEKKVGKIKLYTG